VQQQNSGAVEDFILPYSAVYLRIQQWKNYWNRSTLFCCYRKNKSGTFLWPTVYKVSESIQKWSAEEAAVIRESKEGHRTAEKLVHSFAKYW